MMKYSLTLLILLLVVSCPLIEVVNAAPQPPGNAMDHAVVIGQRPADHAVVIGERPKDSPAGATEHLAPLIFMVMAFLVTVIVGVVLWRKPTWFVPAVLGSIFALVTFLLLADVNFYVTDQHPGIDVSHDNHHWLEMVLSLLACALLLLLFLFINKFLLQYVMLFIAGAGELVVIVILLNIFPHHAYFKLCNGQCVMRGSQAGVAFDLPCADNVAFMALHHTTGITPQEYQDDFAGDSELPHFLEYSSAIAMHSPIYPAVVPSGGGWKSVPVSFSLNESPQNPVAACSLYVMSRRHTREEIEAPSFTFPYLTEGPATLAGVWTRSGGVLTRVFPLNTPADAISHTATFDSETDKVTFISYKFAITYSNPPGEEPTPPESSEVTFVLQDFYSVFPEHPAPVYAQGDMHDVMDVLFIPAQNDAGLDPLDASFFQNFRLGVGKIIKDGIFQEPSLRYWRKHFNFWINPAAGRASDGRCGDCCHVEPANMEFIPSEIEFRALLHSDSQLDFTDHCNQLFSAEVDLVSDNDEKSSFLHELGHAAFGLCDEYPGGFNYEAVEHLPNNWRSRNGATLAAPFRHKTESDVTKLYH